MAQIPYMNWMGNQPSGSAYDVYQYYLGGGSPGGTTPTSGGGITSLPLPLYPQTGGGNDGYKGGGKWGNLDLSQSKTFDKDVFSRDMISMSPIEAAKQGLTTPTNSWQNKQVTGYLNPQTGQYQTFEGKNINHLGINVQPMFASLLGLNKKGPQLGDIKGTFTEGWDKGLENIKEGTEEWFEAVKDKIGWSKKKAKKALDHKKHITAIELKEKQKEERKKEEARNRTGTGGASHLSRSRDQGGLGLSRSQAQSVSDANEAAGYSSWSGLAEGGMVNDPEYRGWKKMYEANPEIGSLHEKHPTFIKFYKQHERDQKKFGGLAGLLYG